MRCQPLSLIPSFCLILLITTTNEAPAATVQDAKLTTAVLNEFGHDIEPDALERASPDQGITHIIITTTDDNYQSVKQRLDKESGKAPKKIVEVPGEWANSWPT